MLPFLRAIPLLLTSGLTSVLSAQWTTSSAPNLPIGDAVGEQTLAKIAATPDGGAWLGWFDNRSGSYAVYLQRFDAAGVEQFAHGGILVSGNPQSTSLVDWDLLCTSQGDCVLTFTDTRAGGDLDVYAYRIAQNGTQLWGGNGVPLSNNADYEANPRVCEANDGDFVFVWPNSVARTIQMQRLDAAGTARFPGDGQAIPGETGATPGFARVVAGAPATGDVVVSWVRTTAFTGNKHIHAQKFDAAGNALWNAGTRVAVFDQASVPIAHDPRLLSDQAGGAILAWHFAIGSVFAARVQRLTAAGAEAFAHNGVDVSTSSNSKFDPAIVWIPLQSEVLVAWNERNTAQTTWGIFAQQLDAAGSRIWGASGITLLPIDTVVKFAPVAAPLRASAANDGFAVGVLVESLGPQQKSVQLFGLTHGGSNAFAPSTVSTVASDKLRLALAATASGSQLLAWTDNRVAGADVYGAAVDASGALGVTPGTSVGGGCGGNPAGSFAVLGRPAIGTTVTLQVGNPVATQSAGSLGCFAFGSAAATFPCGAPLPGFGMNGPTGELLLDPGQALVLQIGGVWAGGTSMVALPFPIPFAAGLLGYTLAVQGLMVDLSPGALVPFGLAGGARLAVGS